MALSRKLFLLISGLVAASAPARAAEYYTEDLRIPMAAGFGSLNVATAGAIALHHLARPARTG